MYFHISLSLIMFKLWGWSLLGSPPPPPHPMFFFFRAAVLRFHALLERENILLFVLDVCSLCHIYKTLSSKDMELLIWFNIVRNRLNIIVYSPLKTLNGTELSLPLGCVLSHWWVVCSHVGGHAAFTRASGLLRTFVGFDVVLSLTPCGQTLDLASAIQTLLLF